MDEINRTKGPIVMFMGHIGVPTKKASYAFAEKPFLNLTCWLDSQRVLL